MRRALAGLLFLLTLLLVSSCPSYAYVEDIDISYYRVLKTHKSQHPDAAKVEEIIRYFADAMYEASNGEMQIGTVRIFQGAAQHISDYRNADVVWEAKGHPSAMPGAGAQYSVARYLGGHISMYDVFSYNGSQVSNFLDNPSYGGYSLASLASSYLFGLRSEYPMTRAGHAFTGTEQATIMKDPSEAAAGNVEALNYSVKSMYTEGITTEQSARWDASGWDYLKENGLLSKAPKGKKAYSTEITANQHSPEALSQLEIIWIAYPDSEEPKKDQEGSNTAQGTVSTPSLPEFAKPGAVGIASPMYILTIDVSASMKGQRFNKARMAAIDYVNALPVGARVGVNIFSDEVYQVASIITLTEKNVKAVKKDLMQKIAGLKLMGNTAMYDGCAVGIKEILSQPDIAYESKNIILFSDGLDNRSKVSRHDVIALAKANDIQISTYGLEGDIDVKVLQELADETDGSSLMTTVPLDSQEHMAEIEYGAGAKSFVEDYTLRAGAGGRSSFYVEPGASRVRAIALTDASGAGKGLKVTARSPKGKNVNVPYSTDTDKHDMVIDNPEPGVWTINIKNSSKNDIYTRVASYTNNTDTMIVPNVQAVNALDSSGILIYASVSVNGIHATGMKVTGVLTGNGVNQKLEFNDASLGEDVMASDGIYTCLYQGDLEDGNYRVAVSFDGKKNVGGSLQRLYMLYPGKEYKVTDGSKVSTQFERAGVHVIQIKNGKVNGSYAPLQAEEYIDYPRLRDKLDLAERAMKRSDFRLAHDYIDEAKRIAPEDRRVFFLNGKIYDAENRYEEALEEYRNAMLLAPYWAENYYRYGQALVNLGEQQDALFVLERMQYLFPNDKWTGKMEAGYTFVFH